MHPGRSASCQIEDRHDQDWSLRRNRFPFERIVHRNQRSFFKRGLVGCLQIQSMEVELSGLRITKSQERRVVRDDPAEALRENFQRFP